jgi:signal transduction histidine kinase
MPKYRFLWRLRAPLSPGEVRRIERWLASARVFLAISALFAIWMDPTVIGYSHWAYWALGVYIVHGFVVMMLLRFRQQSTAAFRLLVHAADVVWPALISIFATGQHSPFFLFFVFVLAAAAYRWGLWETVGTAAAEISVLGLESLMVSHGFVQWADRFFLRHGVPSLGANVSFLEPKYLFMLSVSLLVMGFLLGYLAEQQKRLRTEKEVLANILSGARSEAGMTATLQHILGDLLSIYGGHRAVIASQEVNSYRVYVGEVRQSQQNTRLLNWLQASPSDHDLYLYESPADVCHAVRKNGTVDVLGLDREGKGLRNISTDFLERLGKIYDFRAITTVGFALGQEWWGRIFLFDCLLAGDRQEQLRFLQELVRQVGPAVYNVYLIRRLRLRAGAVERGRLARELHDGAVQSLIAVEMQVDVLRRQSTTQTTPLTDELGRIQGLLREEVLNLRELMQQMKSLDVDATRLLRFLTDTVERFQRETGITARFVSELDEIEMPQRVCRELARIVQEGLVNIRKHSGARQVLVRLATLDNGWKLTLEDDGHGFPFSGRFSQGELEAMGKSPLVINERVHLIAGELTIESTPGRGSLLEISIPHKQEAAYG